MHSIRTKNVVKLIIIVLSVKLIIEIQILEHKLLILFCIKMENSKEDHHVDDSGKNYTQFYVSHYCIKIIVS